MPESATLVLLFTTFPVATETFLQREVEALRAEGVRLELWSLWKGHARFADIPVKRPSALGWISLLYWFPYWMLLRPRALFRVLRPFCHRRPPNLLNFGENLLGLALGLRFARSFARRRGVFSIHAVWASLPATFARTVSILAEKPFSFAAHAYDLFEDGGDWLLAAKCRDADWIRTSTFEGKRRLCAMGAHDLQVSVIRRGLFELPPPREATDSEPDSPLRIVSVGRLVEKMGHRLQLEVYAELRAQQVEFRAELIGDGRERRNLAARIAEMELGDRVHLQGTQPFDVVRKALYDSDLALFTGVVAASGDQAGFPNFVGEAMACGIPVVATPVGAIEEALCDGVNALVAADVVGLVAAIKSIRKDPEAARMRTIRARDWVEREFDARANMRQFRSQLHV